ncbi:MAG: hypothetical protein EPO65_10400 [Dehalococcoidia bacterium]|nr:MAG: hypothetical protein EPO65_10400 [Dehalococcoidia bacterium]
MTAVRRLLPITSAVLLAALASGVVGFVYAHEPARDEVDLVVERERPAGSVTVVGGTVAEVRDGRIRITGERGSTDLPIAAGAPSEELQSLPPSGLATGARVNVGVERSDYGVALSGLVVVAAP